jgi:hypothetical protein
MEETFARWLNDARASGLLTCVRVCGREFAGLIGLLLSERWGAAQLRRQRQRTQSRWKAGGLNSTPEDTRTARNRLWPDRRLSRRSIHGTFRTLTSTLAQLRHPLLVWAFAARREDDLVARRDVHGHLKTVLKGTNRSVRLRSASRDTDGPELAEHSRARRPQKEQMAAVRRPRQTCHTVVVLRGERPAAAGRDRSHDELPLAGFAGDPMTVPRKSVPVQRKGEGSLLPGLEIACSRVLQVSLVNH